jgi:hypothetical protein
MMDYLYHHKHSADGDDECILDLAEESYLGDYEAGIPAVVALLVEEATVGSEGCICAVAHPVAGAPGTVTHTAVAHSLQFFLQKG